jgi:hypothetical protein
MILINTGWGKKFRLFSSSLLILSWIGGAGMPHHCFSHGLHYHFGNRISSHWVVMTVLSFLLASFPQWVGESQGWKSGKGGVFSLIRIMKILASSYDFSNATQVEGFVGGAGETHNEVEKFFYSNNNSNTILSPPKFSTVHFHRSQSP